MFEFDMTPAAQRVQFNGQEHTDSPNVFWNHNEHNAMTGPHDGIDNINMQYDENDYNDDFEDKNIEVQQQIPVTPLSQRLHTSHALHPLTHDEDVTYKSLLAMDNHAEVFVMPTHRIDTAGNLRGFRLVVDSATDCVQLPVTREIFMGSTCVECEPGTKDIHPDVTRLLSNQNEVRSNILKMIQNIAQNPPSDTVSLAHMPVYGDVDAIAVSAVDIYTC